jgi:hypothetical protein
MPIKTGKRMSAAEAVANHLGWDIADVKDARYKYGHTSTPVFTSEDYYYCASKSDGKPATRYLANDSWDWVQCVPNNPLNDKVKWIVWKAHMNK